MIEVKLMVDGEAEADEIAIALRREATAMAPMFPSTAEMLRGLARDVDNQIRVLKGGRV